MPFCVVREFPGNGVYAKLPCQAVGRQNGHQGGWRRRVLVLRPSGCLRRGCGCRVNFQRRRDATVERGQKCVHFTKNFCLGSILWWVLLHAIMTRQELPETRKKWRPCFIQPVQRIRMIVIWHQHIDSEDSQLPG